MADLTGIGYNAGNIDLTTQQAAIARRRAMMAALLMQSMRQDDTQMAGNVAIRQSPMSAIAKVLTAGIASRGMSDADSEERGLVDKSQQQQSDAMQGLLAASQPQPGTQAHVDEEPGPPTAQGEGSVGIYPSTPGGMDPVKFGAASAAATRAGVNPGVLSSMLQQFQRNQMLSRMPNMQQFVPGGGEQPAPATTSQGGASVSFPSPAAPAGGGSGASGGIGGVPGQAAALMLSGDPALEKLGGAINEQNKPISGRAGAPMWTRDANGNLVMGGFAPSTDKGQTLNPDGSIKTTPGFIDSAKEIERSKASVASEFKMVTVKLSDGTETQVPESVILQSQGKAPAAPKSQAGLINLNLQGATPQQAQAALQDAIAGMPATPATAPRATFNRSQTPTAKAEGEGTGKYLSEQAQRIDEDATAAQVVKSRTAEMRPLLDAFDPNLAGPLRLKLGEAALAAGFDKTFADKLAGGDVGAQQAFQKQAIQMAFDATKQLTNRPAASEVLLQIKANPSIGMTKPAMQAILDYTDGIAAWKMKKQELKDGWREQKGTLDGFEGWFNRNNPVENYIPSAASLRQVLAAKPAARVSQGMDLSTGVPQPTTAPPVVKASTYSKLSDEEILRRLGQ